jgi:apolipoprotein N-acyltransferase
MESAATSVEHPAQQRPVAVAAGESAATAPASPAWPLLLCALLSANLVWLCYFPQALGWLGWVALVPFLALVRSRARPWKLYLSAWLAGLLCFTAILQWMRVADDRMVATWLALALYCSLYWPAALLLLRRLDRRTSWPLTLTLPLVWTALEFVRASFWTGFAWYFLAHTQHKVLPLIQVADLTGTYGITFLVAAVNGLTCELLWSWWQTGGVRSLIGQVAVVVLVLAGVVAYGYGRLAQAEFAVGPRVALIQGNLDQRIRNDVPNQARHIFEHYCSLTDEAVRRAPPADLVVWPETSFPKEWCQTTADVAGAEPPPSWHDRPELLEQWKGCQREAEHQRELLDNWVVRRWRTSVLWGLNSYVLDTAGQWRRYNSALLLSPAGQVGPRYDKMVRVPFGEYVPLRDTLPVLQQLAPYDFDYSIWPGEEFTRFEIYGGDGVLYQFGVLICYEDSVAALARQYVRQSPDGPPVDFLINISNDGWFNGTSEHEEHLAVCRFRAVECRRTVVRAVNMGISAVIDGNGAVVALPGPSWAESKKVAGVVVADVPLDNRTSLYARWGDWLPCCCWAVVGLALLPWPRRGHRFLALGPG